MAYTTTANIESKLGAALTTEQVAYFTNVLSGGIDAYINQKTQTMFASVDTTNVYVSGDGSSVLVIPTMNTITAVVRISGADDESVITTSDYVTYPRGEDDKYALRSKSGFWSEGFENYKITGKLGYKKIPEDIIYVATELAVNGLNANTNNYKSEKVGDWSVTYADADKFLSSESLGILASYRRLSRSM